MFRFENLDEYVGLQAPISKDEYIQPTIVLGSSTINATDVVVDALGGEEDDGIDNLKEFDSSSDNEN
jgi:hypothetical protein